MRKDKIAFAVLTVIFAVSASAAILNCPRLIGELRSPDGTVKVRLIETGSSGIGFASVIEYRLAAVRGMVTLLDRTFGMNNDGAELSDRSLTAQWHNGFAEITVTPDEGNARRFIVPMPNVKEAQ